MPKLTPGNMVGQGIEATANKVADGFGKGTEAAKGILARIGSFMGSLDLSELKNPNETKTNDADSSKKEGMPEQVVTEEDVLQAANYQYPTSEAKSGSPDAVTKEDAVAMESATDRERATAASGSPDAVTLDDARAMDDAVTAEQQGVDAQRMDEFVDAERSRTVDVGDEVGADLGNAVAAVPKVEPIIEEPEPNTGGPGLASVPPEGPRGSTEVKPKGEGSKPEQPTAAPTAPNTPAEGEPPAETPAGARKPENPNKPQESPGEPKTHFDKLSNDYDAVAKECDAATAKAAQIRKEMKQMGDPSKLEGEDKAKYDALKAELQSTEREQQKATVKMFAVVLETIKRLFDGTLLSDIQKAKGTDAGKQEPEKKGGKQPPSSPTDMVQGDLLNRKPNTIPEAKDALRDITRDTQKEIDKNTISINTFGKGIEDIKKENETQIDRKGKIEKDLNKLRGEDGKEDEVLALETELERVNSIINGNQKAMDKLDARRDELTKQNKQLEQKREAARVMGENLDKGNEELLLMLDRLAKMLGLKKDNLSVGFNGQPILIINNIQGSNNVVTNAIRELGGKLDANAGRAEISPKESSPGSTAKAAPAAEAPKGSSPGPTAKTEDYGQAAAEVFNM